VGAEKQGVEKPVDLDELLEDLKPYWRLTGSFSMRGVQRMSALWIATKHMDADVQIPIETLRAACRRLKVYDTALFAYYMSDQRWSRRRGNWFLEVRSLGKIVGWRLTGAGQAEAIRLFA
jgi:hypothetical protein